MKNKRLLDIIGEIDDQHIACAAPKAKKSRKQYWGAVAACIAFVVIAAIIIIPNLGQSAPPPSGDHSNAISTDNPPPSHTIDISIVKPDGMVEATYDYGYKSVEELLKVTTLIVRATPVSVELESDVAVCWVLRVEEANKDGVDIIRLRQLKDKHLLKIGQEVVLALQDDVGDGYYYIPGGGCGLFRADEETGAVSGMLLNSLKEHSSSSNKLTLSDVFDILTNMSKN